MKIFKFSFLLAALFFVSGCAKSPLNMYRHKRFYDGVFSFTSKYVVRGSSSDVDDGSYFIGTSGGRFINWDIQKKKTKWVYRTNAAVESRARVHKDSVIFGNAQGILYSLNKESGVINWKYEAKGEITSQAEIHPDGIVYFSSADGVLSAVDFKSGEWLWHYKRNPGADVSIKGISSPFLIGTEMIVIGFSDGTLSALNPNDGSLIWEKKIATKGRFTDIDAKIVYTDSKILVPSFEEGLFCLDKNGNVLWKFEGGGGAFEVLVDNGEVFFASAQGFLYKIDLATGKELFASKFKKSTPTNPVILKGLIVFGTYCGNMYVVNRETGDFVWNYKLSGYIPGNIYADSQNLFVTSSRGDLFIFRAN